MKLPTLLSVSGTIVTVTQHSSECCSHVISLRTMNGIVNLTVSKDTYVVDSARLRVGMRITGFYNANAPVPLIFPPQYQALIIVPTIGQEQVVIGYFNENLVCSDPSLKLNLDTDTSVVTPNGQRYHCNPGGNTLLVYYRTTTKSLPPQTSPRKIIVFC